ncbi:hypothetical protein Tco_1388514, partial [Tanacetum coccineum]
MIVENKYPLRKKVLMQMLKLKLESKEDSSMALELIRFIKKILTELEPEGVLNSPCFMVKSWLVHDQTVHALASPKANELTIPEQTATGKGTSNPLMAVVAKVSSNSSTPGISPDVAALTTEVSELKNMMKTMLIEKQKSQAPAPVKAVEQSCVTCG